MCTATTPTVYLTFDDGPHREFTPRILEILRSCEVKATFFVVGTRLQSTILADIVAEAASDGHTIGNHTFSHPNLTGCSEDQIREEIQKTDLKLLSLGIRCTLIRPPYGSTNRRVAEVAQQLGYEIVLWDNDPHDWRLSKSDDQWVRDALVRVDNDNARVILCHDIHQRTADHLGSLIEELLSRGFGFSSLGAIQLDVDSIER